MREDERYILDLCERALGVRSKRQHRFPFLRGDSGTRGRKGRGYPLTPIPLLPS